MVGGRSREGVPRKAVWLKQNCGVRVGCSEGCDIWGGGGFEGADRVGLGGAGCQKRDARSNDAQVDSNYETLMMANCAFECQSNLDDDVKVRMISYPCLARLGKA
jgi:hypothetical protein